MMDVRPCRTRRRLPAESSFVERNGFSETVEAEPLEQLRFIQETMQHSAAFTAVSGWGLMTVGISALLAAGCATRVTPSSRLWLELWFVEAVIAIAIAAATSYQKAMRNGSPMFSGPAIKVAFGVFPAMFAGGVLTALFWHLGIVHELPGMWMLLYGAGMIAGGIASTAPLSLMGTSFMAAGGLALALRFNSANAAMAIAFGGIHVIFGLIMVRRNDG